MYECCWELMNSLLKHDPMLRRNFKNSVLPSFTLNEGPRTVTRLHLDCRNKPNFFCLIQALGNFDYQRGGHLWIPDLGIFIEFPPGALIMLPSALLRHGNLKLAGRDERRYSFTQYVSGALFRWVRFGFKSKTQVEEEGDFDLLCEVDAEAKGAWKTALVDWPTL